MTEVVTATHPVRPEPNNSVRPEPKHPVRPELVEGHSTNHILPEPNYSVRPEPVEGESAPEQALLTQPGFDKLSPNGGKIKSPNPVRPEPNCSVRPEPVEGHSTNHILAEPNYPVRPEPVEGLDTQSALRFITCGSVDDGKSTLIGRLLVDSRSVMQDQLAHVSKGGEADLAMFTDGLSAEREQGITIDVAWRYFATPRRKFIIGDAPGHEQYTRNMVTAASSAHAAVVLVDATKLPWQQDAALELLPQTRRHTLLVNLLRVPGIVFAVNKLDALEQADAPETAGHAAKAFAKIREALDLFALQAGITVTAVVPVSALKGHNVVQAIPGWCGYRGESLLQILEQLPTTSEHAAALTESGADAAFALPVQWVEKFHASADTSQGRRVFWGRVACGLARPGQAVTLFPSGRTATIAQVVNHVRVPGEVAQGHGAGIVLDREVDVSRGDWILAAPDDQGERASAQWTPQREISGTVAWMDDTPLEPGRVYQVLHGHRWVKAKVKRIIHSLDIHTLQETGATQILPNAIGHIELTLQEPIVTLPYARSRVLGALILVDTASHQTSGALLVH